MYEIIQGSRMVDGIGVETYTREINSASYLEVEAGTTGYRGGDTGHGCRTYFRIKDLGGTDMRINVIRDGCCNSDGFEVMLGGDCELDSIIRALKFITKVLVEQSEPIDYID